MINVIITTPPSNGIAVVNVDNTVTYTPITGFVGNDLFRYLINDSQNVTSNIATVNISVNGSVVQIVTPPQNGAVTVNPDNTVDYNPDFCYAGPDSFTYRINQHPNGISNTATVDIDVKHENIDTWTANDDDYTIETGTTNLLALTDNDTVITVPNPNF